MKIKAVACILFFCLAQAVQSPAQQNIQFTQYIFNTLSVNPAYAGYKEDWFAQLALRRQWSGIEGAPQTGQISIDGLVNPEKKRVGLGLQITADALGPQSAVSAYANYAYRLKLDAADTKRLSFGLSAGITQYALDGSKISTVDGNDQELPQGRIVSTVPDFRLGVYYYTPHWYIGASVMDLMSGDQANNIFRLDENTAYNLRRKRHVYLMSGVLVNLDSDMKLRPSLLVKEDFRGPTSLDLNAMLIFADRFWIGGSYRTGITLWDKSFDSGQHLAKPNSMSGIVEMYITDRFRLGYSYDYIVSKLSTVQNGTHEITLGLTLGKEKRLLSPRFF